MSLHGRKHRIVCSTTKQDTTALEAVALQFRPQSGHNVSPNTTEFYRDSEETGTTTHLEESAPVPVAVDYRKSIQLAADNSSLSFFPFWAVNGSGDSVAALNGSAVNEHIYTGPTTTFSAVSFSMEDQGDPAATDGDINVDVHNVLPVRVVLSGRRRGIYTLNIDLWGGASANNADAQTAGTHARVSGLIYNFGMSHLFTNATLGIDNTPLTTFFGNAGGLDTDAEVLSNTLLDTGAVSVTSALQELSLEFIQDLDPARSMAPGNLTAQAAGYVPTCTDWVYTNTAQQIELEAVFTQNHSAGSDLVETLRSEYQAGTRRAWEFWVVHPASVSGTPDASYYGTKVTLGQCNPISWAEENDGQGERYVRVRYRAGYNTTDSHGWHIATTTTLTTALGAS